MKSHAKQFTSVISDSAAAPLMKPADTRKRRSDDDDNDSGSEYESGSSSASVVPHAARAVRTVMSMPASEPAAPFEQAGARSIITIDTLRKKRQDEGYYADDGLAVAHGKKADDAYGTKFIDDFVERERLLREDPYYRFLQSVVAKAAITTLIDETAMSAATSERVRQAKAEYQRQRSRAVDSPAEQDRLKRSRDQFDAATAELASLSEQKTSFLSARLRLIDAFRLVAMRLPNIDTPPAVPVPAVPVPEVPVPDYTALFGYFTKAACARYGLAGYRRTLIEMRSVAEILHGNTLERVDAVLQLRNAMPNVSYAALLWSALFLISQNSALLERLRECGGTLFADVSADYNRRGGGAAAGTGTACFGGDPAQHAGASEYAADLVALANLVFDNGQQDVIQSAGTNNLLTLEEVSQLLWAHLNRMLARAKSAQPALARPTSAVVERRGGSTKKSVAGIEIQFEISDEDAVRAAGGEEVNGVSQESLAEARRKLYRNEDRARSLGILIELLEPMLRVCYPALFYAREATFDIGYEPLAIAGGYETGEALEVFTDIDVAGAPVLPQLLAPIALLNLSNTIVVKSRIAIGEPVRKSDAAKLLKMPESAELRNAMVRIMNVSPSVLAAYRRRVVERALRRERAVDAFSQYVVSGTALGVIANGAYTKSELAALARYIELAQQNVPASTIDADFVTAENAAAAVLANARPIATVPAPELAELGDALTTSERYVFAQAASATTAPLDERERILTARIGALREQYELLNQRLLEELRKTKAEGMQEIESILRGNGAVEFVATPGVAMAPRNSGVIVLTTLAISAIADAYTHVCEYIPCLTRSYPDADDLILSDDYYVQFARLVRVQLRQNNVDEPDTYLVDRTELRTRIARKSALNSLRTVARYDRRVKHYADARCTCFGLGETAGSSRVRLPRERDNWPQRGL